jgi:hypothetical protein
MKINYGESKLIKGPFNAAYVSCVYDERLGVEIVRVTPTKEHCADEELRYDHFIPYWELIQLPSGKKIDISIREKRCYYVY